VESIVPTSPCRAGPRAPHPRRRGQPGPRLAPPAPPEAGPRRRQSARCGVQLGRTAPHPVHARGGRWPPTPPIARRGPVPRRA
jgi:hypothetical protein